VIPKQHAVRAYREYRGKASSLLVVRCDCIGPSGTVHGAGCIRVWMDHTRTIYGVV